MKLILISIKKLLIYILSIFVVLGDIFGPGPKTELEIALVKRFI